MSAASAPVAPPRLVTAAPVRSLVPVLALQEARRLMRHPVTVLGFAIYVVATVSTVIVDQGPRSAFETVGMVLTFYPGVLMILAGTLLATRDLRAGSGEVGNRVECDFYQLIFSPEAVEPAAVAEVQRDTGHAAAEAACPRVRIDRDRAGSCTGKHCTKVERIDFADRQGKKDDAAGLGWRGVDGLAHRR